MATDAGSFGPDLPPNFGLNSRLDEIQAAILNARLSWLPVFTKKRQEIGRQYSREISNPSVSTLAAPTEEQSHVYHLYVVKTRQRELFQAHLLEAGIQSNIHYPVPIHLQPPSTNIRSDPQGLGHSEAFAQQVVSLPCHPQMTDDDVAYVVSVVNSF